MNIINIFYGKNKLIYKYSEINENEINIGKIILL